MEISLKIPWGNDFYLRIPVVRKYKVESGVVVTRDFPVSQASELFLYAVSACGCKVALETTIEEGSENVLRCKVPGAKLMLGPYGIELCGIYQGRDIHSFARKQFKVVLSTSGAISEPDTYQGYDCYDLDDMLIPFSAPSYPMFDIDPDSMRLLQYGTVDNGRMMLDEYGHLIMETIEDQS